MKELKVAIPLDKGHGTTIQKINGELDAIIIKATGRKDILIESEYGYTIYRSTDAINGIQYIPIRVQAQDPEGHRINGSNAKFMLNEKITITVRQYQYVRYAFNQKPEKQEVKLIIRYE